MRRSGNGVCVGLSDGDIVWTRPREARLQKSRCPICLPTCLRFWRAVAENEGGILYVEVCFATACQVGRQVGKHAGKQLFWNLANHYRVHHLATPLTHHFRFVSYMRIRRVFAKQTKTVDA